MKREYFTGIFITLSLIIILGSRSIFEVEQVEEIINSFIIIWLMIAFMAGQYSTKFPKNKE
jgi:hypothetical protein